MIKKFAAITALLFAPMVSVAQENQISIVALVLTTTDYSPSTDNILESLEVLDAQILLVESPNASQLRSVLKRFASAALDNDIALVFADGPILKLGDREFVAPSDIHIRRKSDLLTQAIPVSALARATDLANLGGAVFIHSIDLGVSLPEGVSLAVEAPIERVGTSPVMLGRDGSAMAFSGLFDDYAQSSSLNLVDFLRDITTRAEFTVSYIPTRPVLISDFTVAAPVVQEAETQTETVVSSGETPIEMPIAETSNGGASSLNLPQIATEETQEQPAEQTEPVVEAETETETVAEAPALSIEMLEAIQNGLSRSDKRSVQSGLQRLGFYRGLIDGIFGNQTKFSIEAYQESIGAEVTGVLSVSQLDGFLN